MILGGDWDANTFPITTQWKIAACLDHWVHHIPWHETGVYDRMMELIRQHGAVDQCRTLGDVIARYERLDQIYRVVKAEGRLRSRSELDPKNFREGGGIYIHVGRSGEPLFGLGGNHRLAIAIALDLSVFPAQVGVVHSKAVKLDWRQMLVTGMT